mmetsp:Transcript_43276/g.135489  ORF Transcript_43276/g.135489 Transcript_43276/m.135489 type:complete len:530 (+) Transcript_43276:3-1592(+)
MLHLKTLPLTLSPSLSPSLSLIPSPQSSPALGLGWLQLRLRLHALGYRWARGSFEVMDGKGRHGLLDHVVLLLLELRGAVLLEPPAPASVPAHERHGDVERVELGQAILARLVPCEADRRQGVHLVAAVLVGGLPEADAVRGAQVGARRRRAEARRVRRHESRAFAEDDAVGVFRREDDQLIRLHGVRGDEARRREVPHLGLALEEVVEVPVQRRRRQARAHVECRRPVAEAAAAGFAAADGVAQEHAAAGPLRAARRGLGHVHRHDAREALDEEDAALAVEGEGALRLADVLLDGGGLERHLLAERVQLARREALVLLHEAHHVLGHAVARRAPDRVHEQVVLRRDLREVVAADLEEHARRRCADRGRALRAQRPGDLAEDAADAELDGRHVAALHDDGAARDDEDGEVRVALLHDDVPALHGLVREGGLHLVPVVAVELLEPLHLVQQRLLVRQVDDGRLEEQLLHLRLDGALHAAVLDVVEQALVVQRVDGDALRVQHRARGDGRRDAAADLRVEALHVEEVMSHL